MRGELTFHKKKSSQEGKASKSKFESDLEKEIDDFVDKLEFEEDPAKKSLQDPKLRRQSLKFQLKESTKIPELAQPIEIAEDLIFSEGSRYLSKEAHDALIIDLVLSTKRMEDAGPKETSEIDLETLGGLSDESIKSIEKIAQASFEEERYTECLGLFSLLCILNPNYSEYWLRLGIMAQKCNNIELASKAYAVTLLLDPNNIGARLFAAECFFRRKLREEAKAELAAAKEIIKAGNVDQMWIDLLASTEALIE